MKSKLKCNTFKSSNRRYQCLRYNQFLQYARFKLDSSKPTSDSWADLAGLGLGDTSMYGDSIIENWVWADWADYMDRPEYW